MEQTTQLTVIFKAHHTPFDDVHQEVILSNYFKSKGVEYRDGTLWA